MKIKLLILAVVYISILAGCMEYHPLETALPVSPTGLPVSILATVQPTPTLPPVSESTQKPYIIPIKTPGPKTCTVNVGRLNVRESGTYYSKIVGWRYIGDSTTVLETKDSWMLFGRVWMITKWADIGAGWVNMRYLDCN
jgi:hypothetical protein